MKKIYTLILLAATAVTSYAKAPTSDSLMLKNTTTQYSSGDIDIALNYPQLYTSPQTGEKTKELAAKLNSDVCQLIASITPIPEVIQKDSLWKTVTNPTHLEIYTIGAAKGTLAEQLGYGGPKIYELFSEWTAFGNNHIVSIFIKTYIFTGGAHGMTIGRMLNYDSQTGKRIDLIKEITDTAFLVDLAAIYFCKERHLPKDALRLRTGLFYELADLPFPDQMGFTAKGLLLYYDPYSIAPYSFGPVAITIPYKELDDVLAENFYKLKVVSGGSKTYNDRTKKKNKEPLF